MHRIVSRALLITLEIFQWVWPQIYTYFNFLYVTGTKWSYKPVIGSWRRLKNLIIFCSPNWLLGPDEGSKISLYIGNTNWLYKNVIGSWWRPNNLTIYHSSRWSIYISYWVLIKAQLYFWYICIDNWLWIHDQQYHNILVALNNLVMIRYTSVRH